MDALLDDTSDDERAMVFPDSVERHDDESYHGSDSEHDGSPSPSPSPSKPKPSIESDAKPKPKAKTASPMRKHAKHVAAARASPSPSPSSSASQSPKRKTTRVTRSPSPSTPKRKTTRVTQSPLPPPSPKPWSRRHDRARHRRHHHVEEEPDPLMLTDAPLPLPAACTEYTEAVMAPDRLVGLVAVMTEKACFGAEDLKRAEAALAAARAKADEMKEAGLSVDPAVAATAKFAATCNRRWEVICDLVTRGVLKRGDEMLNYLTAQQFNMRRHAVKAIRELGDEYA